MHVTMTKLITKTYVCINEQKKRHIGSIFSENPGYPGGVASNVNLGTGVYLEKTCNKNSYTLFFYINKSFLEFPQLLEINENR